MSLQVQHTRPRSVYYEDNTATLATIVAIAILLLAVPLFFLGFFQWLLATKPPQPSFRPSERQREGEASFLDLPREIRDEIYELALIRSRKLQIYEIPDKSRPNRSPLRLNSTRVQTSLLRTCRSIQLEMTPMLYGRNRFRFRTASQMSAWLIQIGGAVAYVRYLEAGVLDIDTLVTMWDFSSLKQSRGLQQVVFGHVWISVDLAIAAVFMEWHRECKKDESRAQVMDLVRIVGIGPSREANLRRILS